MLSDIEKQEMIADALDPKRREAFRKGRELQGLRSVPGKVFVRFLDEMSRLFPKARRPSTKTGGQDFRL